MSDTVISEQRATAPHYSNVRKSPARKSQFVHRLTICLDNSEVEYLAEAKQAFRATESYVVRMALDLFLKNNGFTLQNAERNVR
jgi:hypothetical protein